MSSEMVRYDAMVYAIAECHRVDEVKDLHDKARALEIYAKQAMNVEAERKATEIRLRAERRAGELMAKLRRATPAEAAELSNIAQGKHAPATVAGASEYRDAIDSAGIPERTAQRWQQLANVSVEQFERHLKDADTKPTTNGILRAAQTRRRATAPKTKAGKARLAALNDAATVPYVVATMRACVRALRESPDAAASEMELVDELRSLLDDIADGHYARPIKAA